MDCHKVTGSVTSRQLKNGKKVYDLSYRIFDQKKGKAVQKLKRGFARKGDAVAFLDELKAQHSKTGPPQRMSFQSVADEWFAARVEGRLKPNTVNWYSVSLRNHLMPSLKDLVFYDITPDTLQALYDLKLAEGLSPTTVFYMHRTCKQIWKYAIARGYSTVDITSDPMLMPPKPVKQKHIDVFSWEQIYQLIAFCQLNREFWDMVVPIALAGFMGLRRGELLGLRFSRIDWDEKIITISEQRTKNCSADETAELKTESSYRTLPMPSVVADILIQHKMYLQQHSSKIGKTVDVENGFVCTYLDDKNFGNPMGLTHINKKFKRAVATAGLPETRLHDLRHAYVSNLLLKKTVSLPLLSALAGHSSVETTTRVYSHAIQAAYGTEIAELDALFDGLRNKNEN